VAVTSPKRPLDTSVALTLVVLCVSWGLQNVAVKLALPSVPPVMQMAIRSIGAVLILWVYVTVRRRGPLMHLNADTKWGLLAGALFGIEFIALFIGLGYTTASRATLFLYTAPFFVALGGWILLPGERLRPGQWLGLALSFVAVALALGVRVDLPAGKTLLGDGLSLFAGMCWGATTLLIKASPLSRRAPATEILFYQIAMSAVIATVVALILGERITQMPSVVAWGAMIYMTAWVAGVTYLVWFQLLTRHAATPLQAATTMTPLFGVLGAHFILGEAISLGFALAVALMLVGLVLLNRPPRQVAAPAFD
jgi:drug/metabolite transporter (DMT)-like permease